MIVSNDKYKIDLLRKLVNNGISNDLNNTKSWERTILFPGQKMYMNSIQAYIARQNLRKLEEKKDKLNRVREQYDQKLNVKTLNEYTSDHIYRIEVESRHTFLRSMQDYNIECGIHYRPIHRLIDGNPYYKDKVCINSEACLFNTSSYGDRCVSLPFHEKLSMADVNCVINKVNSITQLHHA
jgi:dTDP-4-amino-4,6-dideoxygalactose transaminase